MCIPNRSCPFHDPTRQRLVGQGGWYGIPASRPSATAGFSLFVCVVLSYQNTIIRHRSAKDPQNTAQYGDFCRTVVGTEPARRFTIKLKWCGLLAAKDRCRASRPGQASFGPIRAEPESGGPAHHIDTRLAREEDHIESAVVRAGAAARIKSCGVLRAVGDDQQAPPIVQHAAPINFKGDPRQSWVPKLGKHGSQVAPVRDRPPATPTETLDDPGVGPDAGHQREQSSIAHAQVSRNGWTIERPNHRGGVCRHPKVPGEQIFRPRGHVIDPRPGGRRSRQGPVQRPVSANHHQRVADLRGVECRSRLAARDVGGSDNNVVPGPPQPFDHRPAQDRRPSAPRRRIDQHGDVHARA